MKIKWIREDQHSPDFGTLIQGEVIDCEARKIPAEVVRSWIAGGWAEEVKIRPVKEKTGG